MHVLCTWLLMLLFLPFMLKYLTFYLDSDFIGVFFTFICILHHICFSLVLTPDHVLPWLFIILLIYLLVKYLLKKIVLLG